jgi:hypothetical protein
MLTATLLFPENLDMMVKIGSKLSEIKRHLIWFATRLKKLVGTLPQKYVAHLCSILFIGLLFVVCFLWIRSGNHTARQQEFEAASPYVNLSSLDLSQPLHKTLLKESLQIFHPDASVQNDSLVARAQRYAAADMAELQALLRSGTGMAWSDFFNILGMYVSFILTYLPVMALTYYGVQTLAIFRFVQEKQQRDSYMAQFAQFIQNMPPYTDASALWPQVRAGGVLLLKAAAKGVLLLVLFSPAYVLSYSLRSRFDTDTFFFMILLGVISNGLLITYAQKFHTFLVAESYKGYVQTAVVKNLNASYESFPVQAIFRIRKQFPNHIFQHIYLNARYQYILTIKEQASFLITGLIIIEMSLNIHGHLAYELLQNMLYEQYDIILFILMCLFLIVKFTEISVDWWKDYEARRYENG